MEMMTLVVITSANFEQRCCNNCKLSSQELERERLQNCGFLC